MSWTLDLLGVVLGFVFLAKGSGWLVEGGSVLGRRWGVTPFVVGLTIVAWGTSLPEVVVSAVAAAKGRPAASLGNVLGSNMANIGMVMGTAAFILPAATASSLRLRYASKFASRSGSAPPPGALQTLDV